MTYDNKQGRKKIRSFVWLKVMDHNNSLDELLTGGSGSGRWASKLTVMGLDGVDGYSIMGLVKGSHRYLEAWAEFFGCRAYGKFRRFIEPLPYKWAFGRGEVMIPCGKFKHFFLEQLTLIEYVCLLMERFGQLAS